MTWIYVQGHRCRKKKSIFENIKIIVARYIGEKIKSKHEKQCFSLAFFYYANEYLHIFIRHDAAQKKRLKMRNFEAVDFGRLYVILLMDTCTNKL